MPNTESEDWLQRALSEQGAFAGTVHVVENGLLALRAAVRIPQQVLALIDRIPIGKGMAGLAWERNEPVTTCNLQDDQSGDVRPGAKAVDAKTAAAIPVYNPEGQVRAVVGFAYADDRQLDDEALQRLKTCAQELPT